MSDKPNVERDFRWAESLRVEAFSDAVFAIIITLLVIEIRRPEVEPGELRSALLAAWPSYTAYILAFMYIGVIWLNHHALFQRIRYVDSPLLWINLGILGTSALMPFPTGVLAGAFQSGDRADQEVAVVVYALVACLMSAAWLPVFPYLHRHRQLAHGHVPELEFRRQYSRPVVGVACYAAAGVLGWYVSPWLAIAVFVGMVVYHAWTSQGVPRLFSTLIRRQPG
jgi:uncharacterized membrane protein